MAAEAGKKVTIDQVARQAGVSKTTVSRYLNHKYENISEETRARIEAVIRELDYRPNRSAQRLKASQSKLIGCCLGDVSSPFTGLLLKGITQVCDAAGYQVLFADSGENAQKERLSIEGFLENRVDGLIVNTPGGNDALLTDIHDWGVPVILVDRGLKRPGRLDTVISENAQSVRSCLRLLLDCGYSRIAFFTETVGRIMPRIQRLQNYRSTLRELSPQEPVVYEFDHSDAVACLRCVNDFRAAFPGERIAILSVNGVTGRQVLLAFQEAGIEAGYDYGLCTFDDWEWFKLVPPGITAMRLQTDLLGTTAARMLLERINGTLPYDAPARSVELPAQLFVRGSTPKTKK